jgi:capsular exopolysaccharide synthesis family protein
MPTTSAAQPFGQRALDDQDRFPAQRPTGVHRDAASRFDVVAGGRRDAPAVVPSPAPHAVSPFAPARAASWSPVPAPGQAVAVEQYRKLAAALIRAQVEQGIKAVLISSAVAGEGKSLTVANLAVTLSRSYHRQTLIIDADERAPSQHEIFRVENARGLSDWVRGRDGTAAATVQLFPGLSLLTAGRPTTDPMAGLTSARMKELLKEASAAFDFVLVDAPPATLVPDAGLLAPLVDASVLVIRAGSTPHAAVERAIAALGRERILGTVLNRADKSSTGSYGYGYGYPRT